MSNVNPYAAPQANSREEQCSDRYEQDRQLRLSHLSAETTVRAMGVVALLLALWRAIQVAAAGSAPTGYVQVIGWIPFLILTGYGLMRLRVWGLWLQMLFSGMLSLSSVLSIYHAYASGTMTVAGNLALLLVNLAIIRLLTRSSCQAVLQPEYAATVQATRGIPWMLPVAIKSFLLAASWMVAIVLATADSASP